MSIDELRDRIARNIADCQLQYNDAWADPDNGEARRIDITSRLDTLYTAVMVINQIEEESS